MLPAKGSLDIKEARKLSARGSETIKESKIQACQVQLPTLPSKASESSYQPTNNSNITSPALSR